MKSKIINKDNYKIHLYKTDKFKSVEVHVLLRNETKLDNYLIKAFIELLHITTKKYKTRIDRYIKQEELYNTTLDVSCSRHGHENIIDFGIEFINPKEVKDDYTGDAIEFLFDFINNPLFDKNKLKEVKDKLIFNYKRIVEHPDALAHINASDLYYENELDKVKFILDEKATNKITMEQIENKYKEIIKNSTIDIFILGDVDESIVDIIDKNNKLKSVDIEFDYFICNPTTEKVKEKQDIKKDVNQAQILLIYNTPLYNHRLAKALSLYSTILGNNGLASRLFSVIREKHQLCYNIHALYGATNSRLDIFTSVDNKNVDKTLKLINEVCDSMKDITDEELDNAKVRLLKKYNSIEDSLSSIYDRLLFEELFGRPSVEKEINTINEITKEEVLDVNNIIKLNTIYVLKGE